MRHVKRMLLIVGLAVSLMVIGLGISTPSGAAGGASVRATVRTHGGECTVSATATWRNMDSVDQVQVWLYRAGVGTHVAYATTTGTPPLRGSLSTVAIAGVDGAEYWSYASVYGGPGGSDQSRNVTLRCH